MEPRDIPVPVRPLKFQIIVSRDSCRARRTASVESFVISQSTVIPLYEYRVPMVGGRWWSVVLVHKSTGSSVLLLPVVLL